MQNTINKLNKLIKKNIIIKLIILFLTSNKFSISFNKFHSQSFKTYNLNSRSDIPVLLYLKPLIIIIIINKFL